MVSKKVLGPALTGTGAVGASGALAWTLGLLDEEILDDVVEVEEKKVDVDSAKQAKPPQGRVDEPASKKPTAHPTSLKGSPGVVGRGDKVIITTQTISGKTATSAYFSSSEATEGDKKAIGENLTWRVVWNGGFESIQIEAGGTENAPVWDCRLRHTSIKKIESDNSSNSELMRQGSDLIKAINENSTHKERFVENCSKIRTDEGKKSNEEGEIKLEVEIDSKGKVKFKESNGYFRKLWTEDFSGVNKLSKDDEKLLDLTENKWNVEEIKEKEKDKTGKVKISAQGKDWSCHISGDYGSDLKGKTFKKNEELRKVLKADKYSYANEKEWKKYLIRNCRKNGMNIMGMKIKISGSNWEFEESSLEKISEGMYTNPTTKP